jgi:3-(methylthio)propanoyl-CoA dehydrogenase
MSYTAPIKDMMFVIRELAGLETLAALPGREQFDADTAEAILEECGKFCAEVVAPLNHVGDKQPSHFENGAVTTTPGFKEAFQQFVQGGWQGLTHPEEYGGQEAPKLISTATSEMLNAANLSFALAPLLTDGAIEALLTAASDELKQKFIPNMISGQWTGTMNLTEPQAGSDLAAVRTRAEPQADGSYKLFGTKIYITYGEHDLAENIVHLVLARCPNAPAGVKGLSLFVAPKFLVNADGSLGNRNDVRCISIEHKLGIKASPTAVLQFGDNGGATGYLVGEENRGLEYMFIMMNAARFAVGVQGIALSDRAYQKAVGYARDRVQSKDLTGPEPVAIIHHPDVKRMLMTMRAYTEGARALAYFSAAACDLSKHHSDAEVRKQMFAFYEFTVPIVKGFSTEMSIDVTSLGVQVHGGMGFIEETGAAQFYRDARILPIYEGTTAIQANDLIGRKTLRDGGATAGYILKEIAATEAKLTASGSPAAQSMRAHLQAGREALQKAVEFIAGNAKTETKAVFAGSVTYLRLCGLVLCGWQMARALLVAQTKEAEDPEFYSAKIMTARFYAEHLLSQAPALSVAITQGGHSANALDENQF